jgi:hypothetical protein
MTKTASSEPALTSREDDLLAKVRAHVTEKNASYPLVGKEEYLAAKRLVGQGRLFYSMDYDHVRPMGNG